jgi:two-component system chemotaxis response regulator CheB
VRLVVIGASMGGPEAVSRVLSDILRLPVPVVLVQHMPPDFTRQLAERLDHLCTSTVLESVGGEELEPEHVYVIVAAVQRSGPVDFASPSGTP